MCLISLDDLVWHKDNLTPQFILLNDIDNFTSQKCLYTSQNNNFGDHPNVSNISRLMFDSKNSKLLLAIRFLDCLDGTIY